MPGALFLDARHCEFYLVGAGSFLYSYKYSLALFWIWVGSVQFSSVAQSCPTHCDPMHCSTPGLPVHHQLLEFTQIDDWHPTISSSVIPFSSCLQSLPGSGSFPMSQFFTSGGQSIGVSASASVPPMNTQD